MSHYFLCTPLAEYQTNLIRTHSIFGHMHCLFTVSWWIFIISSSLKCGWKGKIIRWNIHGTLHTRGGGGGGETWTLFSSHQSDRTDTAASESTNGKNIPSQRVEKTIAFYIQILHVRRSTRLLRFLTKQGFSEICPDCYLYLLSKLLMSVDVFHVLQNVLIFAPLNLLSSSILSTRKPRGHDLRSKKT